MIEEHFDADDEMSSVKWKDKTAAMETSKGDRQASHHFLYSNCRFLILREYCMWLNDLYMSNQELLHVF